MCMLLMDLGHYVYEYMHLSTCTHVSMYEYNIMLLFFTCNCLEIPKPEKDLATYSIIIIIIIS